MIIPRDHRLMNTTLNTPTSKGYAVAAGEGERIWIVGDTMTFKSTGESTGGRLLLFENLTVPGGGPPPHIHTREDEFFFVLDGTFEIRIGDELHTLGPGGHAYVPRGTVHNFRNTARDTQPHPRGLHAQRDGGLLPPVGSARDRRRAGAPSERGRDRPHAGGRAEVRRRGRLLRRVRPAARPASRPATADGRARLCLARREGGLGRTGDRRRRGSQIR